MNATYAEGPIPGPTAGYYYTQDENGGYELTHGYVRGSFGLPGASIMGSEDSVSTGWSIQDQFNLPGAGGAHVLGVSLEP